MNSTALSTKGVKLAVSALLAAAAFMALGLALGANNAKASTVGGSINPEFNYVGLNVEAAGSELDSIVLEPPADPIGINGTYTDTNGNFSVPEVGGLDFPPVQVDLDVVQIDGEIGLTKDGTGHYDESTGAMSLDLSLSLTLGVDDLEALGNELGIPLGTGALACRLAPLNVEFTTGNGWPHPGKAFEDKEALTDGALAGAWRYKPSISVVEGDAAVCGIIGGFLGDVGGIWLANSTDPIVEMPAATSAKPSKYICEEDGLVGTPPNCEEPVEEVCPPGTTGTFPDCVPVVVPKANISKVTVTKTKVKAGKRAKIRVTVVNNGTAAFKGKVALKSTNKQVKVQKSIGINVGAKKKVTKVVVVKTTKRAKGKARIIATVAKKKGVGVVTVQKAKKKRRR